jgi:LacI family transcriptional regulator
MTLLKLFEMNAQYNVTIKDIAKQLKLSVSTVSRALRGNTDIRKETRIIVCELAEKLGYSPNPIALSLKERKSRSIGVIVPEIANNFCSSTIAGIEEVAYSRGYHVNIFQSHETLAREILNTQLVASRRMDGLIISMSNETSEFKHITNITEKGIPVVMFDRVNEDIKAHKVVVDDARGAYLATEHLVRQGFRKIAHLTISPVLSITRNRLKGFLDAMEDNNIAVNKNWIQHCNFDPADIDSKIRSLFTGDSKPDAIMASVERIVVRCLGVLQEMKINIPGDCALIGFSDNPLNRFLNPSLSSISQPTLEIGKRAATLLIDQIENQSVETGYTTVQLETILEIRDSTRKKI